MLLILIGYLVKWIKKPVSWICLGGMVVLFLPAFQLIDFHPFFSAILLIVAIILAAVVSAVVSGLRSAVLVVTSGARVKELAQSYPELAVLEKKHSALVGLRLIFIVVCVAAVLLGLMAFGMASVGLVSIIAPIAYLLLIRKKEIALRDSFKQVIVLDELTRAFTDVQFDPHGRFPFEEIAGLRLFNDLHRIRGNDLIDARRAGMHFCRCDMFLERIYVYQDKNGDEQTGYNTIFGGSVFRFELSEPSPVRLLAATENFPNLREADGSLKKLLGRTGEHSVETEMDEFNRRFDVYCSDQTAARILLTPQMIEGIHRVGQLTKQALALLFEGNALYLFLSTPNVDSFEVAISGSQSLKKQHEIVAAQVALIAAIVDNMYFKGTGSPLSS